MAIYLSWMGAPGEDSGGVTNSDVTNFMPDMDQYFSFIDESSYSNFNTLLNGTYTPAQNTRPIIGEVLSGTGTNLICQIPKKAMDDFTISVTGYVDDIESNWGNSSDIEMFYLEEPDNNSWSTTEVGDLKTELTNKDLIVNLQEAASQSTVNSYASSSVSDYICMPSYPLTDAGGGDFDNIENIAKSSGNENALYKMGQANRPYFFVVQACDPGGTQRAPKVTGSGSGRRSAELDWMAYRALVADDTPSGLFFYQWVRATEGLHYAVENLCNDITNSTANLTTILPTTEQNSDVTVNSGSSDILFQYREVSGKHYLLVVDKKPETSGAKSFDVTCDVGGQYTDFDSVLEVYSGNEVTGSSKVAPSSVNFDDEVSQGGYKLYRFLEI